MTSFVDIDAHNVVGIRIDGKISDREFDAITALLEEKMREHSQVRMYAEIESFGGASLETILKDMKFGIKNWNRFEKEAVITEKNGWKRLLICLTKFFRQLK